VEAQIKIRVGQAVKAGETIIAEYAERTSNASPP
jgi:hypothetical protein